MGDNLRYSIVEGFRCEAQSQKRNINSYETFLRYIRTTQFETWVADSVLPVGSQLDPFWPLRSLNLNHGLLIPSCLLVLGFVSFAIKTTQFKTELV